MIKFRDVLLGATAFAGLASPAVAKSPSTVEQRLDTMQRTIDRQNAEILQLKAHEADRAATPAPAPTPDAEVATKADILTLQQKVDDAAANAKTSPKIAMKNGRPTISSADGKSTLSIRADVMGDYASFDKGHIGSGAGTQLMRSGANFRRAQFGFEGKVAGDFGYKLMYEFGGAGGAESGQPGSTTQGRIKEAFITYKGILDPFTFKIGAFPPPANLNDATSSDDLFFNERPSSSQLSRGLAGDDGRYAVGFLGNGHIWNLSAFLTGDTEGKGSVNSQGGYIVRGAIAPIQDQAANLTLHIGANYTSVFRPQETAAGTYNVSLSDRPELRVWDVKLINSGNIAARSAAAYGVELGFSWQAFTIQGEKYWYDVDRRNPAVGVTDPSFDGWYVEGSYVLTGEPRRYSMSAAAFGRPSPAHPFKPQNGDWGAWELAGRYSEVDLNYNTSSSVLADRVLGGKQDIYAVGLNFYPNDILKFMFDFQNIDVQKPGAVETKYNAFSVRSQLAF
jgi:phosphate-selective porin OprO and OprP